MNSSSAPHLRNGPDAAPGSHGAESDVPHARSEV